MLKTQFHDLDITRRARIMMTGQGNLELDGRIAHAEHLDSQTASAINGRRTPCGVTLEAPPSWWPNLLAP
jgi:hypothetical protein